MNEQKLKNILNLTAEERYRMFIADVVNKEEIWVLNDEEGVLTLNDDDNQIILPLWSEREFCELFKDRNNLIGFEPISVDVYEVMDEWIDEAIALPHSFAIFPLPNLRGPVIRPEKLREDLDAEIENY